MTALALKFALSLIAVGALVALAHFMGFSRGGKLVSKSEAAELLALAAGGFESENILVDSEGRGALGQDGAGRLAALIPHGGHFVARLLGADARCGLDDGRLSVISSALGPKAFVLTLDAAPPPPWIVQLVDAR